MLSRRVYRLSPGLPATTHFYADCFLIAISLRPIPSGHDSAWISLGELAKSCQPTLGTHLELYIERVERERRLASTRVLEDGLISTKSGDDRTTCDCNANETDLMSSRNNESVDLQSGYFAFSIFSILRRGKFAKFEESFF